MKICVYCASAENIALEYKKVARELGAQMVARGHSLVYGGGAVGLMGELARSAAANGGYTLGVIPHKLKKLELAYQGASKLIFTENMRIRKSVMQDNADGFIALPGGYGTLEEILEMITLRKLGYHHKPIVFLNTAGFYDKFLEFLDFTIEKGFSKKKKLFAVVDDPQQALAELESAVGEV